MKTKNAEIETERNTPLTEENQVQKFVELRAQGHSLGKISQLLAVPKSTLYGWNRRNRETIDHLKRIELEAIEERIIGSGQEQFAILTSMLNLLQTSLSEKIREEAEDLSINELFWMAASLRNQLGRLRSQVALTDLPDTELPSAQTRTISYENPSPSSSCP
jgi:hypothetical protein